MKTLFHECSIRVFKYVHIEVTYFYIKLGLI